LQGGEKVDPEAFKQYWMHTVQMADLIWSILDEDDKLIGVIYQGGSARGKETHASWMDWATPRDILTGAISFWAKVNRRQTIVIVIPEATDKFMEHLCEHGICRRVGKIYKYYPDKQDALVWQSNER
jgi:hypothetical protein